MKAAARPGLRMAGWAGGGRGLRAWWQGLLLLLALPVLTLSGCTPGEPGPPRTDVIVVGAGMAGLAAAIEAAAGGARVTVLDSNSVGGGHAILASGFSLVGTPLQERMGYRDDVEAAIADILAWGEDADPWWVRHYVEASRPEVHDWLVARGVQFAMILPNPEDSIPRFHLPRGAAAGAALPVLREALANERISFIWNHEVSGLLRDASGVSGIRARDLRSGGQLELHASAVILATGGFESNDRLVREHWPAARAVPDPLYVGAGHFATGGGLQLASDAGAALVRMDRQLVYVTGMPDPRDAAGRRGLLVLNPAAIMVDGSGRRFIDEAGASKDIEALVLSRSPATYWLVFDEPARAQLMIRGGPWLDAGTIEREIMADPALVSRGGDIRALALAAGLPADELAATVARYNRFVREGEDADFRRFGGATTGHLPPLLDTPPFYAIQLFPMTRKSMGGIAIDHQTRVLDAAGRPIRGLYAAGEVTGIAGINGSHGGSGTFLGPSLLQGRMAGQAAAAMLAPGRGDEAPPAIGALHADDTVPPDDPPPLDGRLVSEEPGFWHFRQVHRMVVQRELACGDCHQAGWPPGPARTREQQLLQFEACTRCH